MVWWYEKIKLIDMEPLVNQSIETCFGRLDKRRKTFLTQVAVIRRDLKKHEVTST